MLVIRMQRTGRKGHAMFRVVVQDSRRTPTSGKIVAQLGSYDPHAKNVIINKEKAQFYLEHGAQPSDRVALLLKKEGVKLPTWVVLADKKSSEIRNPEKLRRNRPPEPEAPAEEPASEEAPAPEAPADEQVAEAPAETAPEAPAEEPVADTETPAESEAAEPAATEEATPAPETEASPEAELTEEPAAEAPTEEAAAETPAEPEEESKA